MVYDLDFNKGQIKCLLLVIYLFNFKKIANCTLIIYVEYLNYCYFLNSYFSINTNDQLVTITI